MEIRFASSSKRFLDSQPDNVRSKLINDVLYLRDNHHLSPDDPSITPFLMAPTVGKLFRDAFHWIIFSIDGELLMVANIGLSSETPHLWRPRNLTDEP
jgi:hypothetical protein